MGGRRLGDPERRAVLALVVVGSANLDLIVGANLVYRDKKQKRGKLTVAGDVGRKI